MLKFFMVLGWLIVVLSAICVLAALVVGDFSQAAENFQSGVILAASLTFLKAVSA